MPKSFYINTSEEKNFFTLLKRNILILYWKYGIIKLREKCCISIYYLGVICMQMKTIGQRIRHLRVKNSMTQEALANILYVSNNTVSSWERGRTQPDITIIVQMANFFRVSLNFLLIGENFTLWLLVRGWNFFIAQFVQFYWLFFKNPIKLIHQMFVSYSIFSFFLHLLFNRLCILQRHILAE